MGRLFLSSSSSDDGGSSSSRGFSIGALGAGGSCMGLEEKEEDEEVAASRRRSCCERDVFGGLRGRRAGCGGERGWVCGWEEEDEQAWRVSLRRLRDMDGGGGAPAGPCRGRTPKRRRQFWFGRRVFWLIQQRTNGQKQWPRRFLRFGEYDDDSRLLISM